MELHYFFSNSNLNTSLQDKVYLIYVVANETIKNMSFCMDPQSLREDRSINVLTPKG